MQRFLLAMAATALGLPTPAQAPCFEQNFGVLAPLTGGQAGFGDDVLFDVQPMNISFPMGGVSPSYTHAQVCENGIVYLTTGGTTPTVNATYAYQNTAWFVGTAGDSPRVAPLFVDLWSQPQNGGGVYINNTLPGKFVVTWVNMVEWYATTLPGTPAQFTFQAQLFDTGDVWFYYGPTVYGTVHPTQLVARCGVSEGNGVLDPGPVDLTIGNTNLTSYVMYEEFAPNVFDLQDQGVQFINAGSGYLQLASPCQPAAHQSYGGGCYDISNSFYEFLTDATFAPAFDGQAMTFTASGPEYLVAWGGASFLPAAGATPLTLTDDGEASVALSTPFPTVAGPVSTLYVGANGIVSLAANATSGYYTPDRGLFLNATPTAWYSWHDFNPAEASSGQVTYLEQVTANGTIACITWDGVESYPAGVLNPSTLQFQFNLTNGDVAIVWQSMDSDPSSTFGSAHLIGWSPGGPSTDPGSAALAGLAPFLTSTNQIFAPDLDASPAPISTPTSGTAITYTTSNMREYVAGSNLYIGLNLMSLGQNPGLPLGFLGAPGCSAYIASIDFAQAIVGAGPSNGVVLNLPAGLPGGFQIFSQSICLITPNSMPNGQNAFGMLTSNGLTSTISNF